MIVSPRRIAQNLMGDDERLIPHKDNKSIHERESLRRRISEKEQYREELIAAIRVETEEDTQFKLMTMLLRTTENTSALKETLATLESTITTKPEDFPTAAELRKLIKSHPLINPKAKIQIGRIHNQHWISFTTKPIVLRPSKNPHEYIDDGQIPYVHLGAIVTTVSLSSGAIFVFCPSRNSTRKLGFRGRSVLHPHQTSRNEVCLGDFKSIFLEAIQTGDTLMLLDTIKLFFEQAYDDDVAGKNWVKWVVPHNFSPYNVTPEGIWTQKITTSPDKPAEVVRGEDLSEVYVPNSTPPQRVFDIWDGIAPLRTGHIVIDSQRSGVRYVACMDGETYLTTSHPACSIKDTFYKLYSPTDVRAPTTDEILRELRIAPTNFEIGARHQLYWQLYDHEEHTPILDDRLHVLTPRYNNALTIKRECVLRLQGPMSIAKRYGLGDMINATEYEHVNDIVVQRMDPIPIDGIVFHEAGEPPLIGQWVCGIGMIADINTHTVSIANKNYSVTQFTFQNEHLPKTDTPTMRFITRLTNATLFKTALTTVRNINTNMELVDPRMRDLIFVPSFVEV